MTPLNSLRRYYLAGFSAILLIITGCGSNSGTCSGCSTNSFKPNVDIKIVDANSRKDIFFGSDKRFTTGELKIKHVQHGVVDSIPSIFKIDSVNHTFNFDLRYQYDVDTVSLQVGTLKPQFLYLSTGSLASCCTRVVVTAATYQDSIIFQAPTDPSKQAKMPNLVTVPFTGK